MYRLFHVNPVICLLIFEESALECWNINFGQFFQKKNPNFIKMISENFDHLPVQLNSILADAYGCCLILLERPGKLLIFFQILSLLINHNGRT